MKSRPPVRANAVATYLIQVARAPSDKKFERRVRDQRRQFLHHAPEKSSPPACTTSDIVCDLKLIKSGTAPGFDNTRPEFLIHLGLRSRTWMSHFFTTVIEENQMPKTGGVRSKVIDIEKPGTDPKLAARCHGMGPFNFPYLLDGHCLFDVGAIF
jgi:hypothetical protein